MKCERTGIYREEKKVLVIVFVRLYLMANSYITRNYLYLNVVVYLNSDLHGWFYRLPGLT